MTKQGTAGKITELIIKNATNKVLRINTRSTRRIYFQK